MKNIFSRRVNHPELEDRELVALAKDDAEAFGELYARYVKKMYSYIFHRTGNTQDAEDLTAKVFIRAYSHIGNYVDRGAPFQAWLYRIAHNLVANWHRDQARRKIIALDDYVAHSLQSEAPERLAEDVEERDQLMESVRRLPEERQQLLLLKFIEQLSNAEIGEIMGRTEGAIKSLYHRTLLALRDDMQRTPEAGQQRRLDGTEV